MSVYVFDTETTDRNDDRQIIEAAWHRVRPVDGLLGPDPDRIPPTIEVAERFYQRYKPEKPITLGSMAVHHIVPSELEACPSSSTFQLPADVKYLIGHSIDFDWQAAGSPPHVKRICTHAIAQHVWPGADSHSLVALLYMLRGPTPATRQIVHGAHGAAVDARNCLFLLEHILQARPEITIWSALWEFSEQCRIPLRMPFTHARGKLLSELEDGLILWCLERDIDPYLRKGLEQEWERRYPRRQYRNGTDDEDDLPF